MRFSRHARNQMRGLGIAPRDVRAFVGSEAGWISLARNGNIRVTGVIGGHGVRVVIAIDDPVYVITVHAYRGGAW